MAGGRPTLTPPPSRETAMDLVWIITRTHDEYGHSMFEDDPVTATREDARAAFNRVLTPHTISLADVPESPEARLEVGDYILRCIPVQTGLHRDSLQARLAELEQESAEIRSQLNANRHEIMQIDEDLKREAPWNA